MQKSKAREYLDKDREMILWLFDYRCIRCGRKTSILHEIVPISHGKSSLHWKNRVPLCSFPEVKYGETCHNWAHSVGTNISIPILQEKRKVFLIRKFLIDEN